MEPADLQPLSSYGGCFGSQEPWAVTKPSLSSRDTSRQEGAAPKGCSLGFVSFLKNRDCFLAQEQVSTPHSGVSRCISFPRHSPVECSHPRRSAAAEQTPCTAKPAGDTPSPVREARTEGIHQGWGKVNSALRGPWKPPPANAPATRARLPTFFLNAFVSFATKMPRARQCCQAVTITIGHFCIPLPGSGLL